MRHFQVAAATLAISLAALACGGDDEAGVDGNGSASSPQLVEVIAKDFSFVPAKLRGSVGVPIEITLKNTGQVSHTFTVDEFNVDTEIAAGEETTVTVVPPNPGEFNYYCRFHEGRGMRGAITTTGEDGSGAGAGSPSDEPATETDDYSY